MSQNGDITKTTLLVHNSWFLTYCWIFHTCLCVPGFVTAGLKMEGGKHKIEPNKIVDEFVTNPMAMYCARKVAFFSLWRVRLISTRPFLGNLFLRIIGMLL